MANAKNELIMLWVLLTANADKSPGNAGGDAAGLFNQITSAVRVALNNAGWNWPGLGATNASDLVADAVKTEQAGGTLGPYGTVNQDFVNASQNIAAWSGGNDHPSPAELVKALGIS